MTDAITYAAFLENKRRQVQPAGRAVDPGEVNPMLHPWQQRVVQWAVRTGRNAVWADTGTGKTFMQLEYARLSGCRALVIAPLAVCHQTVREAAKLGIEARYARTGDEADGPGIWVTNYERALRFDPAALDTVVLDEASILKQSDGKTRTALIKHFAEVKHRQACTATPAPNDNEELTSQAEFVGVMPRVEMLAAYFVHDDEGWRVKGHARGPMFRWMATWAVALRRPSDIGGDDTGYILPGLDIIPHLLPVDVTPDGQLFATDLGGVGGRAKIRKATLDARTARDGRVGHCRAGRAVGHLVRPECRGRHRGHETDPGRGQCARGDVPGGEGRGAAGFRRPENPGDRDVSRRSASFGMNWQHCARMAFCGLGDSYEQYYQAIRRCYRYGQTRRVHAHVVLSELEGRIAENVARKEKQAAQMTEELVREMRAAGELAL